MYTCIVCACRYLSVQRYIWWSVCLTSETHTIIGHDAQHETVQYRNQMPSALCPPPSCAATSLCVCLTVIHTAAGHLAHHHSMLYARMDMPYCRATGFSTKTVATHRRSPCTSLDCVQCKNRVPYCVATGLRMVANDWSFCPSCRFPALYSKFKALIDSEKVRIVPMYTCVWVCM